MGNFLRSAAKVTGAAVRGRKMLTNTLTWGLAPVGCRHEKLITKTCLNNVDPLKPLLYSKPGVLQGYTVFFLFLLKNIDCGYSLEPLRRGGSNEYTQSVF